MQFCYEMNVLRKNSISIEEYCLKFTILVDKLACASSPVSDRDLLMRVLNGLRPGYLDLALLLLLIKWHNMMHMHCFLCIRLYYNKIKMLNQYLMPIIEWWTLTILQLEVMVKEEALVIGDTRDIFIMETRINHNSGRGLFYHTYPKGFPFDGNNFGRGHSLKMQFHKSASHSRPTFNISHGQSFIPNRDGFDESILGCQICHKSSHKTNACWHKYIENYIPQSRHFGRGRRSKSAYMASFEPYA